MQSGISAVLLVLQQQDLQDYPTINEHQRQDMHILRNEY
jgi:hypothetical protein